MKSKGEPSKKLRILAIIPAFNEEKSIVSVAQRTANACAGIDVLVINDCSSDHTAVLLRQNGIQHITLPVNLGIGGAVQTGFLYAWEHGHDAAIQVDGDGQHTPEQIPLLIHALQENDWDVVIGSRYARGSQIVSTWARRLGGGLLGGMIRLATGRRISDPTSGFRAYNRRALDFVRTYYPQEYPEPVSAIELLMHGFRVGEVPIMMQERQHGTSSITGLNTLFYMIKVMFAILIVKIRRRK